MGKIEQIRIKQDGATMQLVGGTSRVCRTGDVLRVDELDEQQLKRLRAGDPWTTELAELQEVDERVAASSPSPAVAGAFDPSQHTAKQVTDHLRESPPAEVERVKELERAGKKRATILEYEPKGQGGAPGESGPPVPEYDSLDVAQVLAVLRANESDEDFVARVKAYEAEHEKRQEILDYDPTPPRTQGTPGAGGGE